MRIETSFFNQTVEFLPGCYGGERNDELRALARLYNRRIGPITSLNVLRPESLDLSMHSAYCHHVPVPALIRDVMVKEAPHLQPLPGGGKGITAFRAVLGALGEMSERLLATLYFARLFDSVVYSSYDDLVRQGRRALGPQDILLFAEEQYAQPDFEYVPFEGDSFLGWVQGAGLLDEQPVLVPAQLVLMYYKPHPMEPAIGYATTAGLAFHGSARQAILHGLYEVIERDALNIRWYSKLPPRRVDVDLEGALVDSLDMDPDQLRMHTPYVEVDLFDMTLDTPIPVLAAIAFDRSREERSFLGGTGGASRREHALMQALGEVGQCQTGFRFDDPFGRNPIYSDTDLSEVVEFFDAPLFYGHAKNLPRVFWFTSSPERVPWVEVPTLRFNTAAEEFDGVRAWLESTDLKPIVFHFDDCFPLDIALTKVYVAGLTQACPPKNPTLGHPRFYELPQRLGLSDRRLRFADLNRDPIPFA